MGAGCAKSNIDCCLASTERKGRLSSHTVGWLKLSRPGDAPSRESQITQQCPGNERGRTWKKKGYNAVSVVCKSDFYKTASFFVPASLCDGSLWQEVTKQPRICSLEARGGFYEVWPKQKLRYRVLNAKFRLHTWYQKEAVYWKLISPLLYFPYTSPAVWMSHK